jgi:hypothetical protein
MLLPNGEYLHDPFLITFSENQPEDPKNGLVNTEIKLMLMNSHLCKPDRFWEMGGYIFDLRLLNNKGNSIHATINGKSDDNLRFSVFAETSLISAFTSLQSTEIGQNSPLFLLATSIISVVGFLYNNWSKTESLKQKSSILENISVTNSKISNGNLEQVKKEIRLLERRSRRFRFDPEISTKLTTSKELLETEQEKAEITNRFTRIRSEIRQFLITASNGQDAFDKLKEEVKKLNEAKQIKIIDSVIPLLNSVLEISSGVITQSEIENLPSEWIEDFGAALYYAAIQQRGTSADLYVALSRISAQRCSPELKQKLLYRQGELKIGREFSSQKRSWPHSSAWGCHNSQDPGQIMIETGVYNPFYSEAAEQDTDWLFYDRRAGQKMLKGMIWREHPIYNRIIRCNRHPIFTVVGDKGSGKTALALASGIYNRSTSSLNITLTGSPSLEDIYRTFSARLFEFISLHPTFLGDLESAEKSLLLRVLLSYAEKSSLEKKILDISVHDNWLKVSGGTLAQKEFWKKEVDFQLRTLQRLFEQINGKDLSEREWPEAFQVVCDALKFTEKVGVLDGNLSVTGKWIQKTIIANRSAWALAGIQAVLFYNQEVSLNPALMKVLADEEIPVENLAWDSGAGGNLKSLIEHRWNCLNRPFPIHSYIPEVDLNDLISQAAGNPRRFIHLWNERLKRLTPVL